MAGGYSTPDTDPMDALVGQLNDLRARVAELERPTGTQTAQAVEQLQLAFTELAAQVANQVVPAVGSASNNSFTLGTGYAEICGFNLAVPDGYTRAVISSYGTVAQLSNRGGDDTMAVKMVVAGNSNPESLIAMTATSPYGDVSAFGGNTLTGLTAGQTLRVSLQAHIGVGPGSTAHSTSMTAATALFQK